MVLKSETLSLMFRPDRHFFLLMLHVTCHFWFETRLETTTGSVPFWYLPFTRPTFFHGLTNMCHSQLNFVCIAIEGGRKLSFTYLHSSLQFCLYLCNTEFRLFKHCLFSEINRDLTYPICSLVALGVKSCMKSIKNEDKTRFLWKTEPLSARESVDNLVILHL